MRIKLLIFSLLFSVVVWGQTSVQNFGTGTGSNTTTTGNTTLIPNPTSGTTWARGGNGGSVNLVTTSNPLGTTGAYVRAVAPTGAAVVKFSPWVGYTGGTEFYTSFKVLFGDSSANNTATSGTWAFYQGAGGMYSDANDFSGAQVFTGLRFTYGAGGSITLNNRAAGAWSTAGLTTSTFSSGTVYTIEIVGNNKTSGTINYTYNCVARTVAVQKFDLYINGTLVGDDLAEAQLSANASINSGTFIGTNSTSNVSNVFVDDAITYNAVPSSIGTSSHTVTFNANGGSGSMSPQTSCGSANLTTNTYTNSGFTFNGWNTASNGSGTSYTDGQTYNFSADITLYAQWTPVASGNIITVTQATGGTISPGTSSGITNGSNLDFTASPTSCYDFTNWVVDGSNVGNSNPYSFTNITANHTITAVYTIKTFAISANAGVNGSISPNGVTNVNCGSNQTYTITPNAGYLVQDVLVDGVSLGSITSYTFNNVTATHTISVTFTSPCFSEDFASILAGDNTTTGGSGTLWSGNTNFPAAANSSAYNAGGAVKLGTSSVPGYITSKTLTGLSGNLAVVFDVKGWTTVEGDIKVTLGGSVQTVSYTAVMAGSFETKTLNFTGIPLNPTLKIETTAKRAFIDNVKIICGAPLSPCTTPSAQATLLNFSSVTSTSFNGAYTAASPVPSGYLVVYSTNATLSALDLPVDGVTYSLGNSIGDGTVAYVGNGNSFSVSGLTLGTTYNVFIFSYNSGTCITSYNTNLPLTGNVTTVSMINDLCNNATTLIVNAAPVAGDMTGSTLTAPFTKKDRWYTFTATCSSTHAITVSGFTGDIDIELFSGSCPTTTTFIDNSNGATSTETISIVLTAGTTYYVRVLAFDTTAETSGFNVGVTAGSSLNISNTGSPAAGNINTGTNNVVIMGVTTTPACATSYDVSSIILTKAATSTVASTDISNFRIFYDANSNGVVDGAETSVSGAGIALSASMSFTLVGQTGLTTEKRYLLVADVSATAVVGRKIKVDLSPNSNLVATINPAGTKNGIALGNVQTIVTPSCTPVTIVSVMPASGPVGTQVTITASTGNLTSATASFNGVAGTIVSSSATQLVVTVPTGATTGNLIVTDAQPCSSAAIAFTVVDKDITSCQSSSLITDLFISEVTDASSGSLTYVEIYNGTSSSIDMAALNYAVRFTNYNGTLNDGASGVDVDLSLAGVLAPGDKFIFGTTVGTACVVPGGNGSLANQTGVHSGINNNDLVKLVKGGAVIDVWGFADDTRFWITDLGLGDRGYDFERKNTVSAPSTTFNANDWIIIDWDSCSDDYSNIATYIPVAATPVITIQPTISVSCTTTSANLSVTANEGYSGGNPLAYQWYVVAPNTATWTPVTNGGIYSGATSANLVISSVATLDGYQFYCQVRENTATCYIASNSVFVSVPSTVWNGTIWTKGAPDTAKIAVIDGNYDTAANGDFECCSLFVNTNYTLTIKGGDFVAVINNITNSGTLNIENNGSLVQVNDVGVNTGVINMQRTAFVDYRDYVYWSTPVANFNSANISTFSNNSNLYKWIPTVPGNGIGDFGNWTNGTETMVLGKGYIERGLNNASLNSPTNFTSTFTGVPNNGSITTSISRGTYNTVGVYPSPYSPTNATQDDDNWNLLGNPYPSSISVDAFLTANSSNLDGFVKIWLHGIAPNTSAADPFYNNYSYNYDSNDYLTYNLSGPSTPGVFDGYIGAGQGFITRMSTTSISTSATAVFNNSMRSKTYRNDQFYRNSNNNVSVLPQGRIWIDLVSSTASSSTLVAYVNGATNGKDQMYDADANLKANFSIYSLLEGYDRNIIQGRSLPFDQNDQVPLAVKIPSNGNYTIGIKDVDGFFNNASQSIYLEDKLSNAIHDLRSAPYHFTSTSGEFVDRFVLRYTNQTLGNDHFEVLDNSVKVYTSDNSIVINSLVESIKTYEIYNVLGQMLVSKKQVKVNKAEETSLQKTNQALIVKVTLKNGKSFTKKILH
ncbi:MULTISPECIES: InlB B-repeat-containing protein [Flavobacterium]|uniref:Uncharacterized protein n=1 Tax=Flavobacterium hankyongi TaxID=1176532 RepID=A0ABP8ZQQ4_9FLAO|nr:InlB B-repeat-containing protein [Flavobacterium sp. N1846]